MAKEIHKKDLYDILGVSENATEKELVKGYRKKALKCHPDKNPNNPMANDLFLELSRALEVLTDGAARAAYDQARRAKKAAKERNKVLDVRRKKFKDDLEAREKWFEEENAKTSSEKMERDLQREIERLRKEGSRLLQQEQERLRQELHRSNTPHHDDNVTGTAHEFEVPRIKLKWKATKGDSQNGGYNPDVLNRILSPYGQINTLLVSTKRNGSAIVEFEKYAVTSDILNETGLADNPCTIIWLSGKPTKNKAQPAFSTTDGCTSSDNISVPRDINIVGQNYETSGVNLTGANLLNGSQKNTDVHEDSGMHGRDFESLILWKMRQAQERKRLIEQMKDEDDGNV